MSDLHFKKKRITLKGSCSLSDQVYCNSLNSSPGQLIFSSCEFECFRSFLMDYTSIQLDKEGIKGRGDSKKGGGVII